MLADAEADVTQAKEQVREAETVVRFCRRHIERLTADTPEISAITEALRPASFGGKTLPEAVKIILADRGRPMHVRDIASQLVRGGYPESKHLKVSIFSALRRRDDLFVKAAKATFALQNGVDTKAAGSHTG